MKRSINLFSIVLIGLFSITTLNNQAFAQDDQDNAEGPKFEYKLENNNNRIDLGTMYLDAIEQVNLEIEFENMGNQPLVLSDVRACCGTRVIEYTEEPVSPGEVGIIKVSFRVTPRPHNVNRTVLARSNDPAGQKVLRIVGRVEQKEE